MKREQVVAAARVHCQQLQEVQWRACIITMAFSASVTCTCQRWADPACIALSASLLGLHQAALSHSHGMSHTCSLA